MACTAAIGDNAGAELRDLVSDPPDDKCGDELFMSSSHLLEGTTKIAATVFARSVDYSTTLVHQVGPQVSATQRPISRGGPGSHLR